MKILITCALSLLMISNLCLADGQQEQINPFSYQQEIFQGPTGGFSRAILAKQHFEPIAIPTIEQAIIIAGQQASQLAESLIDTSFHRGQRLLVPDQFPTIQQAIDQAKAGDSVIVKPGIYYEQLMVKDGVRLLSEAGSSGDELQAVEGARLKLPARSLSTIIDGSKAIASARGMLNFPVGASRHTIVDGFTIRNLPEQNHHTPGHAHAINIRGASPTIINCQITANGSTGIGSHVIYHDQNKAIPERDFRQANIKSQASGLLYRNIVSNNLGRGIGCNHFSSPMILGNDLFGNDDSKLGESVGPGIGAKHGAAPTIIGNIVHDHLSGGIMIKYGAPQGKHGIDLRPKPEVRANVVFNNGAEYPNISCHQSGTEQQPAIISGNFVYQAGNMAIGVTEQSIAIIENNLISGSRFVGIAVKESRLLRLNGNTITAVQTAGVLVSKDSVLDQMVDNRVFRIGGLPFLRKDLNKL